MKIITFQQGGTMNLVDYIPVLQKPLSGGGQKKTSSDDKKSGNELEKAIYKVLDENGLQSDSEIFYTYAQSLLEDVAFGIGSHSASQLIQLRKYANLLVNNKKLYDNAEEHMRAHNTGDDYALTTEGKVYIGRQTEEGKFELNTVKISELKEKLDEWSPITNKTLLQLRDSSNEFAFRKDMLLDVGGSIGMEDVEEAIHKTINNFGKRKTTQYPNLTDVVSKGMDILYKITIEHSMAYQDVMEDNKLKKDVSAAINYLYSTLNGNAKNVLKLKAELNNSSVQEILTSAIALYSDYIETPDIEKNPAGKGSGSGKEDSGLKTTQT